MDKYIGFDMDDKKTMACVIQEGCPDRFETLPTVVIPASLSFRT